jgi:hypothetical protein
VLAKLLWDPNLDGQQLIDQFVDGYYGPAGAHIKDYLNTIHDAVEASGDWLGCFEKYTADYLSFDTLNTAWTHLKAAEKAVRDNPELLFRIQAAQLPVMYTFMMRWDEMRQKAEQTGADWPMPRTIRDTFQKFMKVAEKKNITRLNEWNEGFAALEQAIERAKR